MMMYNNNKNNNQALVAQEFQINQMSSDLNNHSPQVGSEEEDIEKSEILLSTVYQDALGVQAILKIISEKQKQAEKLKAVDQVDDRHLRVFYELNKSAFYTIKCESATIGRVKTQSIAVSDKRVSKSHARIEYNPSCKQYFMIDASTNGTFKQIKQIQLQQGQQIVFGKSTVYLQVDQILQTNTLNLVLQVSIKDFQQPNEGTQVNLEFLKNGQQYSIGRLNENDIIIKNDHISRNHAFLVLVVHQSQYAIVLIDKSSAGTYLRLQKEEPDLIQDGDQYLLGNSCLNFEVQEIKHTQLKEMETQQLLALGKICCICMMNSVQTILRPCGHKAMCQKCTFQLIQNQSINMMSESKMTCPVCRSSFQDYIFIDVE